MSDPDLELWVVPVPESTGTDSCYLAIVSGLKPRMLISLDCSGITILELFSSDAWVTSICLSVWALPTKYFSAAVETFWISL